MRIFNWVNRKLHHKDGQHEYCRGIGKDVVKERQVEYEGIDVEAVDALLLNGWTAGGILTIGTLGLMVLGDHASVEPKGSEDYYDDDHDVEEEETCLVNNNGDGDLDSNNEEYEEEDEEDLDDHCLIIMETKEEETQKTSNYDHKTHDYYVPHNKEMLGEATTMTEKKKERTTLADLFSAEYSDVDDVGKTRKSSVNNIRKIWPTTAYHFKANSKKRDQATNGATTATSSLSFAKRLIPLTGIDKQPVKKFHKLMRRMLNRKIHPELGGKLASKTDDTTDEAQPSYEVANAESISLLRTRD